MTHPHPPREDVLPIITNDPGAGPVWTPGD